MQGHWHPLKPSMSIDKEPLFGTKLLLSEQKVFYWKWLQLTWVEEGTGTAVGGPGLRVEGDASPLELHLRVLVQDLLDLDLHLCMGAFIVSGHYLHHQDCRDKNK